MQADDHHGDDQAKADQATSYRHEVARPFQNSGDPTHGRPNSRSILKQGLSSASKRQSPSFLVYAHGRNGDAAVEFRGRVAIAERYSARSAMDWRQFTG